jgi:hypothetical protein
LEAVNQGCMAAPMAPAPIPQALPPMNNPMWPNQIPSADANLFDLNAWAGGNRSAMGSGNGMIDAAMLVGAPVSKAMMAAHDQRHQLAEGGVGRVGSGSTMFPSSQLEQLQRLMQLNKQPNGAMDVMRLNSDTIIPPRQPSMGSCMLTSEEDALENWGRLQRK